VDNAARGGQCSTRWTMQHVVDDAARSGTTARFISAASANQKGKKTGSLVTPQRISRHTATISRWSLTRHRLIIAVSGRLLHHCRTTGIVATSFARYHPNGSSRGRSVPAEWVQGDDGQHGQHANPSQRTCQSIPVNVPIHPSERDNPSQPACRHNWCAGMRASVTSLKGVAVDRNVLLLDGQGLSSSLRVNRTLTRPDQTSTLQASPQQQWHPQKAPL
jgi:hypothetical protein